MNRTKISLYTRILFSAIALLLSGFVIANGTVATNPNKPYPGFKPHELSFQLPTHYKNPSIANSDNFYAILLKSDKPCSLTENLRSKYQTLLPDHKVFATKFGCNSITPETVYYANVRRDFDFIAVHAGENLEQAKRVLKKVIAIGHFENPNIRQMQVVKINIENKDKTFSLKFSNGTSKTFNDVPLLSWNEYQRYSYKGKDKSNAYYILESYRINIYTAKKNYPDTLFVNIKTGKEHLLFLHYYQSADGKHILSQSQKYIHLYKVSADKMAFIKTLTTIFEPKIEWISNTQINLTANFNPATYSVPSMLYAKIQLIDKRWQFKLIASTRPPINKQTEAKKQNTHKRNPEKQLAAQYADLKNGNAAGKMHAHYVVANRNYALGNHKEAEKHYLIAMKLSYKIKQWHMLQAGAGLLARCYTVSGQYSKAIGVYRVFIYYGKKYPKHVNVRYLYLQLAKVYHLKGRYRKSIATYKNT